MIGNLNISSKEVTVVGAGVSGLIVSYFLSKKGFQVRLLEQQGQSGGLIRTTQNNFGISESAAHSFLATDALTSLCTEIGIELIPVKNRSRYILRRGKLHRFPFKAHEVFDLLLRACLLKSTHVENLEQWGLRHLGTGFTKYGLNPFLIGIYGAQASDLSLQAVFREWKDRQRLVSYFLKQRSKSRSTIMAPKLGMQSFIEALETRLEERLGSNFKKNTSVENLPINKNIILAVPAYEAAKLLKKIDPALSQCLEQIFYVPLITATVFYPKNTFLKKGIGCLIPKEENFKILGILFNSQTFENRAASRYESFTCLLGGTLSPDIMQSTNDQIKDWIVGDIKKILKINETPIYFEIYRHKKAIPLYSSKLLEAWKQAQIGWCSKPGQMLFGNYTGAISIRGMVESVQNRLRDVEL